MKKNIGLLVLCVGCLGLSVISVIMSLVIYNGKFDNLIPCTIAFVYFGFWTIVFSFVTSEIIKITEKSLRDCNHKGR